MCPACILTIGGGLLIAKKLGVNDTLAIGLLTILLSVILDLILRKFNHGKVFSPYQRVITTIVLLLTVVLLFKII
ncbi:MAG: hypothetical protein ACD_12C00093G0002 [uncultured bacterium]|nr:MAG: hypothetical protein ACD_12C00093G0002 [uncultured bacterium]